MKDLRWSINDAVAASAWFGDIQGLSLGAQPQGTALSGNQFAIVLHHSNGQGASVQDGRANSEHYCEVEIVGWNGTRVMEVADYLFDNLHRTSGTATDAQSSDGVTFHYYPEGVGFEFIDQDGYHATIELRIEVIKSEV